MAEIGRVRFVARPPFKPSSRPRAKAFDFSERARRGARPL